MSIAGVVCDDRPMFMLHGRFAAKPGMRDNLLAVLTEVASGGPLPGCRLYVVSVDQQDSDGVWATEIWESEAAHAASLELEVTREQIGRAMQFVDPEGLMHQELNALSGIPR